MPTTREARYISPNDIGKIVTYVHPAHSAVLPEGEELKLGGRLLDMETEAQWYVTQPLCEGTETRELGRLNIKLNLDGQWVKFGPSDSVTVHGQDQR